jgi:hypothetical protein
MRVTRAMIAAAQRPEFDINRRMRRLDAERFIPTPPEVVRAMLEAALAVAPTPRSQMKAAQEAKPGELAERRPKLTIVSARKPRLRR